MRRAFFVLLALAVLAGLTGCVQNRACRGKPTCTLPGSCACSPETCRPCRPPSCDVLAGCEVWDGYPQAQQVMDPGPPSGAVTYPYYTVRGPRDFLARDPRPIGP